MLATEDVCVCVCVCVCMCVTSTLWLTDCLNLDTVLVSLIARTERVLMELSMLITERPGLARKAWKTSEPLWEKPFQNQDLVASKRISWVAEDELQEEDHLSKQSFVSKAILHW